MMCIAGNDDELADWAAFQTATASAWKRGWAKGTLKEWGHDLLQKVLFKVPSRSFSAASQLHCQSVMLNSRVTAHMKGVESYTAVLVLVIGLLGSNYDMAFLYVADCPHREHTGAEGGGGRGSVLEEDHQWRGPEQELGLRMGSGDALAPNGVTAYSSQEDEMTTPHWMCVFSNSSACWKAGA